MAKIPVKKIKQLPDIFSHITYKQVAKAIGMKPVTLRRYVNRTPGKFRLGDVYRMATFLECDGWWLMGLVVRWCGERAD